MRRIAAVLLLTLLAACSGGHMARGPGRIGENVPIEPDRGGRYKVGKPYTIKGVTYVPRVDYNYDETGIASWYGPGFHGEKTANGERYNQRELTAAHKTLPMPSLVEVTNLENGRAVVVRVNDRGPYAAGRIIDLSERAAELLDMRRAGIARVRVRLMAEESRALASGRRPSVNLATRPTEIASADTMRPARPSRPPPPDIPPSAIPDRTIAAITPPPNAIVPPPIPSLPALSRQPVVPTHIFIQTGSFGLPANAQRAAGKLAEYGPTRVHPVDVNGQVFQRVQIGPLPSVEAADELLTRLIANGHPNARVVVEDN